MSEPRWDTADVAAVRSLEPSFTDDEVTRLLDQYKSDGRRNPVSYATNGKSSRRLLRDLERVRSGEIAEEGKAAGAAEPVTRRLVLTRASQIKPRAVRWGWAERAPAGHVTLIPGREGIGKSLFLIDMCAKVTLGILEGCYHGQPRNTLYCSSEDSWHETIVPRLKAAGANLDMVFRADVETVEVTTGNTVTAELTMPQDIALVAAEIKRHDMAVLALDPLMSVIDSRVDTNKDRELRTVLEPLGRLARDTGAMIIGLAHFNKGAGSDPLNLVTGSRAFTSVVRSVISIAIDDKSDDGHRVISQEKNNLGRLDLPSLTYVVEPEVIEADDGEDVKTARIRFTGKSERSVRDILSDNETPADRTERAQCAEWLRGKLKAGPQPSTDIEAEGKALGYSESTINRARKQLKVSATKTGRGRKPWLLELPKTAPAPAPLEAS